MEPGPTPRLAPTLAVLAGCAALLAWRYRPPPVRPADAPAGEFSALRARASLAAVLGDQQPHPVASEANLRVADRLEAELRRLGLEPTRQDDFACRGTVPLCARLRNVLARIEGRDPTRAVALVAHYDSRPAAPGAADDGAGVAALLEAGRALRAGPPLDRAVILLFTDGEEWNLLGAEAFAARHPWAAQVTAVVNVECRGTSGPSLLFETSPGNAALMGRYARAVDRPIASSLFYWIYRVMPNDTDLTVFKERGVPGFNLAAIGDPLRYHTRLDDLDHLDPGTLQHHGENALALARELARGPAPARGGGDAVFFDLFGLALVWWPARGSWLLGLGLLVAWAALLWRGTRDGPLPRARVLGAAGAQAAATLAGTSAGAGVLAGLRAAGALPGRFVAFPLPALGAALGASFLGLWLVGRRLGRAPGASPAATLAGQGLLATLLGLACARFLPTTEYLCLVPAAAAAAGLALGGAGLGVPLAALGTGLVWMPVLVLAYQGLGFAVLPLFPLVASLVLSPLLALLPTVPAALPGAAALALLGAGGLAALAPPSTPELPRPMSFAWVDDAADPPARLVAAVEGALPPELTRVARFGPERTIQGAPWKARQLLSTPAAGDPLEAPTLEAAEAPAGAGRRLALRVRSRRGADTLILGLPPPEGLVSVRLGGLLLPETWWKAHRRWMVRTPAASGLEVELVTRFPGRIPLELGDRTQGLPPALAWAAAARPPDAGPVHEGDLAVVVRRTED